MRVVGRTDRHFLIIQFFAALLLLFIGLIFAWYSASSLELDTYPKWSKVELEFSGPESLGMGDPNPFQIPMEVAFTGPDSQVYTVPAFYDGDGAGGLDGTVWKVRFSAGDTGTWTYLTTSGEESLDGFSGSFQVSGNIGCQPTLPNGLPDFSCTGRLEYSGEHYLQFTNGDYWLKSGANEPEDFISV